VFSRASGGFSTKDVQVDFAEYQKERNRRANLLPNPTSGGDTIQSTFLLPASHPKDIIYRLGWSDSQIEIPLLLPEKNKKEEKKSAKSIGIVKEQTTSPLVMTTV
jgi:hypothetical protein